MLVLRALAPVLRALVLVLVSRVLVVRTKPVRRPDGAAARPGSGTSRTC
ncbi:hypothetical protein [Streptomyces sp. NBC_00448]